MKAKINLSIEEKLVYKIKAYAEKQHTSVSELVEEYFRRVVEKPEKNNLIEFVKSLPKVELPYPDDVDLKKQYYEENAAKYGF
jgi:DNA-directed RNA polymerase beta' subunit